MTSTPLLRIDPTVERRQIDRVQGVRAGRDHRLWSDAGAP